MTCRQKAMKNTRQVNERIITVRKKWHCEIWFCNNTNKIVGYDYPEAFGTLKRLKKQTFFWQSARSASGCGIIPNCLAGPLTAVSTAILIIFSDTCRKFTASSHLVTKKALCTWLSPSMIHSPLPHLSSFCRSVGKVMSDVEWNRSYIKACDWPKGLRSEQ